MFRVIDTITGKVADDYDIALKEDWASGLIYCDMQGFAIHEDGSLILLDECGNYRECPSDRFIIETLDESVILPKGAYYNLKQIAQTNVENAVSKKGDIIKELFENLYLYFSKLNRFQYNESCEMIKCFAKRYYDIDIEEI